MSDCQPCVSVACCPPSDFGYYSDMVEVWQISDFGTNDANEIAVAAWLNAKAPTTIITAGNNDYVGSYASSVGIHYPRPIRRLRFFPCMGNRDWDYANGTAYASYFTWLNSARYYDVRMGPVHFFILDAGWNTARVLREGDGNAPDSLQAQKMLSRARASTAPFKIGVIHDPPFSSGSVYGSNLPLQWDYAGAGICAVLSGHENSYERLSIGGVQYLVNGLGGAAITGFNAPIDGSVIRYNALRGALRIRARQNRLDMTFFNTLDVAVDSATINA